VKEKTKGIVVVASNKPNFYVMALQLIDSIRDFDEDINITLVCEDWMEDERAREFANNVIHCDGHYRAKIWGMTQSPYDLTMYIDADMHCEHEDISKCFDELGDHDVMFSALTDDRSYVYAERDFDTPDGPAQFHLCGGVCLYDMSKPIVREFIQDWWDLTRRQMDKQWWPDGYAESLRSWDQFSLWWLTNKEEKYKDLSVGIFKDDLRWNYYNAFKPSITFPETGPVILRHYSCGINKDDYII